MENIKFIIADDHKIFRQGLRLALSDDPKLKCIGEAGNGHELISLVAQQKPDVILLDLKMPEMDGMEALKQIRTKDKDIKIIIITMHEDEHFIVHLMEAGANGYLVKNAEPEEINMAIHAAHDNGFYFNDHVSQVMLKTLMQKDGHMPTFKPAIELTERETEVLKYICQEFTAAEIASKLFLSTRTIEGVKSGLIEKIGVKNTAGLVMYAVKNGIAD